MIVGKKWYKFDDRALTHNGVIVDLGCEGWGWSKHFVKKGKRVIGVDPQEKNEIKGAKLINKIVVPHSFYKDGITLYNQDCGATIIANQKTKSNNQNIFPTISLDEIIEELDMMPSLLKINIEGAEYFLLMSLREPPADQLVVSFHDFGKLGGCFTKELSETVRNYLSIWYEWQPSFEECSWWIGLLKEEFRQNA